MKKILFILIAVQALTLNLFAQSSKLNESSIPESVKSKFKSLYPGSKVEYWAKEEGNYVAEFDYQKKENVVFFTPDGKLIKSEARIHSYELPAEAQAYIAKHYPGKKVTDAVTTKDHQGNQIYEAEVGELDLIFDAKGQFIKSVKERPLE